MFLNRIAVGGHQWVRDLLGEPLGVDQLASRLAMSVRNFSRTFTREFGSTPAKFVARLRVETAKRLLEDSEKSMEQVAVECGFGSVDSMRRNFREQTDRPPRAFRRLAPRGTAYPSV